MIELDKAVKEELKRKRLEQYKIQLYNLQMDLAAFEAIGDQEMIQKTKEAIEQGLKAYNAVEAME